ncbi:Transcription factor, MADS-box [Penicillium italicum]|uniref:Transcription factor, MADS-box n=1 Tax=Penicillium italicum TaxID=40296 RepID=A0A0A2L7L3_PENIT|nr:Transcription factor, MADS-box [Penicillium italicum]
MVAKRQSESVRAKSQQRYRCKRSLFKKAKEFFLECESDVFMAVRIRKNGQIYIFDSSMQNQWLRDLSNLVYVVSCT